MTEQDPRATFAADQAEARAEGESRERQQYAIQVRQAEAHALQNEALAVRLARQAELCQAAANVVSALGFVLALHGLKRLVRR